MGNKLRHEEDEVRIKVIWPDVLLRIIFVSRLTTCQLALSLLHSACVNWMSIVAGFS